MGTLGMYIHTYIYTSIYICIYTHLYIHTYTCIPTCLPTYVPTYLRAHVYIYYIIYMNMYIYMYIHMEDIRILEVPSEGDHSGNLPYATLRHSLLLLLKGEWGNGLLQLSRCNLHVYPYLRYST